MRLCGGGVGDDLAAPDRGGGIERGPASCTAGLALTARVTKGVAPARLPSCAPLSGHALGTLAPIALHQLEVQRVAERVGRCGSMASAARASAAASA